jgi:hypothetical protein
METANVYYANGLRKALDALRQLDSESKDLLIGLALVLLVRDNGDDDWYVYANLENPKPADTARVTSVLAQCGTKTDYSLNQVLHHAHLGFSGSGSLDQISTALRALIGTVGGEKARKMEQLLDSSPR